ncbi:MAG: hypothetical protein GXO39_00670 [Thermotogae bacterium]|nr:hypothetical protein [Thermotogota bacterium]
MTTALGIYDAHILLRHSEKLKEALFLVREIVQFYPCMCLRNMCLLEDSSNEFLPSSGVIHLRDIEPKRVAVFLGRALRNFYGRNAENFLLLHASAVAHRGEAYMFLGQHAWGKSTVAKGFLKETYGYLSDDMVALNPRDGLIYPTLPVDISTPLDRISPPVPLSSLFLVRYVPHLTEPRITPLNPHETYLYVVENLLNPKALKGEGLSLLLKVLLASKGYRVEYGDWRVLLKMVQS